MGERESADTTPPRPFREKLARETEQSRNNAGRAADEHYVNQSNGSDHALRVLPPRAEGARYELLERIGRGGTGDVYRARDRLHGERRDVCVKRLPNLVGAEHASSLREEARLLGSVRHANVVSLLDSGEDEMGAPYLVLELIEGQNLRHLCRAIDAADCDARFECTGFLPDRLSVHVGCALLRGLAAVQRALPGIVHRDVTPHNVLVSNEGEVKLADFGIALARDRARSTGPCIVKGKLGYLSPEQARGEELDPRSDLFAVGVLLYELLAKIRPWPAARGMPELRALERGDSVSLARLRPSLDASLVRVVERMLSRDRELRPSTADDALRALAPFSDGDLASLRLTALISRLAESRMKEGS
jgi:serine/threonine protein kinase